jgi:hypothetical protein
MKFCGTELSWAVCWLVPVNDSGPSLRRLSCNRIELVNPRWALALVTDALPFTKLLAPSVCGGGEQPQRFGGTRNNLRVQMLACYIVNNNCITCVSLVVVL